MTSITIPSLDDDLRRRLEQRAAGHGRSVEAEARDILRSALEESAGIDRGDNLGDRIRAIVEPIGGIELQVPPRMAAREPPIFE